MGFTLSFTSMPIRATNAMGIPSSIQSSIQTEQIYNFKREKIRKKIKTKKTFFKHLNMKQKREIQ
jgi:hypothetical protein